MTIDTIWVFTFLILNLYPESGSTSHSQGSPSICGGWIGWSGEENALKTLWVKSWEKSAATSIRRSGEVSQQVVLVSGLCAGFAKIWAEDHTVVVTQWIPPLLPEAFEKPRHAWRGGKNAWRGFLLSQVPQSRGWGTWLVHTWVHWKRRSRDRLEVMSLSLPGWSPCY